MAGGSTVSDARQTGTLLISQRGFTGSRFVMPRRNSRICLRSPMTAVPTTRGTGRHRRGNFRKRPSHPGGKPSVSTSRRKAAVSTYSVITCVCWRNGKGNTSRNPRGRKSTAGFLKRAAGRTTWNTSSTKCSCQAPSWKGPDSSGITERRS